MKKIITVVGARPQFVKAAVVSEQFGKFSKLEEVMVHTGQHYDENMSNVFFSELEMVPPKYTLDVNNCSHAEMTGKMLIELDKVFDKEMPDGVLVYGDTNSTLAAALVAAKRGVPIFHVEAGLRSYNREMPEEVNRILTDHLSAVLFTPCENASLTLKGEGIEDKKIFNVGDVMFDLFLKVRPRLNKQNNPINKYVVCTIHRQDNTDDQKKLTKIFEKLDAVCEGMDVIMPIHPRTQSKVERYGIKTKVKFVSPLSYINMMELVSGSEFVVTDSGGLQKEAFFNEKVCITVRSETEWNELLEINWNILFDLDKDDEILDSFEKLNIEKQNDAKPYGSGAASYEILKNIEEFLG